MYSPKKTRASVAKRALVKEVTKSTVTKSIVTKSKPTLAKKAKVVELSPTPARKAKVVELTPIPAKKAKVVELIPTPAKKAKAVELTPTPPKKAKVVELIPTPAKKAKVVALSPTPARKIRGKKGKGSGLKSAPKAAKMPELNPTPVKKAKASQLKRGIVLLNHIPHGFYEEEMRQYFSQFGRVLRLRLARSKTTGKSKGYAFIEFEFEEVAKIVAEAMNGYLMFERLMKCELLPSTVDPVKLFSFSYIREDNYPKLRARRRVKDDQIKQKSEEEVKDILEFRLKKLNEQNKKWADLGIKYKYTPPTVNTA